MKPKYFNISVYERVQCYGGPEEGGWYYDHYSFLRSINIKGKSKNSYNFTPTKRFKKVFQKFIEDVGNYGRYSYEGGTEWFAEKRLGCNETTETPHYE